MSNKKRIRLVVLDLDGTLLNEKFELTTEVKTAVRQARGSNLMVIVATGRDRKSAEVFLQELGVTQVVITSGGALVWVNGKIISQCSFTPDQFNDIMTIGQDYQAGFFVDQPEQSWMFGNRFYTEMYAHVSDSMPTDKIESMANPSPIKVSIIQDRKVLGEIQNKITKQYPELALVQPFEHVVDVNPSGASKGAALLLLENLLGIGMDEIAVVGDSENDISMFKVAGLSYAMGNAPEHIQAIADRVVSGNDQNGAAEAIDLILGYNRGYEKFRV